MDDLVSLTIMVGTIFFCSEKCGIVPDWSWTPNPWLVFDGVEDFIDGESQRSEMLFHRLVSLERI